MGTQEAKLVKHDTITNSRKGKWLYQKGIVITAY